MSRGTSPSPSPEVLEGKRTAGNVTLMETTFSPLEHHVRSVGCEVVTDRDFFRWGRGRCTFEKRVYLVVN